VCVCVCVCVCAWGHLHVVEQSLESVAQRRARLDAGPSLCQVFARLEAVLALQVSVLSRQLRHLKMGERVGG
jgi:hypothetical protein